MDNDSRLIDTALDVTPQGHIHKARPVMATGTRQPILACDLGGDIGLIHALDGGHVGEVAY